jgi:hypothetical protein
VIVDEQLELLREIARWTREAALPVATERVARLVEGDGKKRVYEAMADGTSNVTAIEKATGVNHNDIAEWLKVWRAEGIVDANPKTPKALFTLTELGIEPAPPRKPRARKASAP